MNRRLALFLVLALTATTLAWAGDTMGPTTACPPDCQPCPGPCSTICLPGD